MKFILFIIVFLFNIDTFAQKFEIEGKHFKNGYILAYIEYSDSVIFEKNSIVYCFVEDKRFNNVYLKKLYKKFRNAFSDKYKYFIRADEPIKFHDSAIAIFSEYLSRYPDIIKDSNLYPKLFISEILNASYQMLNNNLSKGFLDLSIKPALKPGEKFGIYYFMIKADLVYYKVNYNCFKQYEHDFINSSNDLREKQLVGLSGIWSYAKIKRIKKDDPYPVLLPIRIKYR